MVTLLLAAAIAACPDETFTFTGQPACVELAFTGESTALVNLCEQPVLVDQSVARATSAHAAASIVPAGASAELRDLSVFTIGVDGRLYRVVATLADVEGCLAPE